MGTDYEVTITNFGGNDCSDDQFKFALKSVYTITSSSQIEGNRYMITSVPTAISVAMVDSIYDNHYLSCSTFTIEDKTFYDVRTLSQCSGGENLWTSYTDTLDHPEWGELEFEVEVNSDSFVFDSEEKTRVSDDGCTGITFALNLVIIIVVVVVVIIIIVIIVIIVIVVALFVLTRVGRRAKAVGGIKGKSTKSTASKKSLSKKESTKKNVKV